MQNKGFTLIELLVVIVIIGILATISVATFSGYFKKARDVERTSFVTNAKTIVLAEQVGSDTSDYRLETAGVVNDTAAEMNASVDAALAAQNYAVPTSKNSYDYYYVINSDVTAAAATGFAVVSCSEETTTVLISASGGTAFTPGTCALNVFTVGGANTSTQL